MQELTLSTIIAVLVEMFGAGVFWSLVMFFLVVTIAYVYVLIRDRSISMRKYLLAQLSMPFGALAAVMIVMGATHSHLGNLGGPIDVLMVLAVALVGAIGAAILAYTAQSLLKRPGANS